MQICENVFEREDMALCPAYSGPICSLCCTLESRCHDLCKPHGRIADQLWMLSASVLPQPVATALNSRGGHFAGIFIVCNLVTGLLLSFIYHDTAASRRARDSVETTLWLVFLSLLLLSGIGAWLIVLAHESRRVRGSRIGTTDRNADGGNRSAPAYRRGSAARKGSRRGGQSGEDALHLGLSHEIRTPLNSIFGYAQLLERGAPDHPTTRCASSGAAPSICPT